MAAHFAGLSPASLQQVLITEYTPGAAIGWHRDKAVFGTSGYGARQGFGKRPALLIIDVNWAFCGDKSEPILESIKKWRNSCGEDAWTALPYIR